MGQVNFNIPDGKMPEVVEAFAALHSYKDKVLHPESGKYVPNPESKQVFMKRMIAEYIKQMVLRYRESQITEVDDLNIT